MGRRLTSLSNDTDSITYNYDAEGQRVSKTVNRTTTEFYYDDRGSLILSKTGDTEIYFYPDADGSIGSINYNDERYYYVRNAQNDIIGITDKTGAFVVRYTYDEWGNITSITDGNGNDVSGNPNHLANLNPLRYRSYFYDTETGFYWLNTRYYNPEVGRFLNADGQINQQEGVTGYNMFAYCGNNPVNRIDPTGQFGISALLLTGLVAVCSLSLSGCSEEPDPIPEPYKSAEEAAIAFSEEVYSSSLYIRHEYCAEIYSRTINGETTYNYTTPRVGKPHSAKIRPLTPSGTKMVAYAHTHPISNVFSPDDITVAKDYGIDGYVVGPSLELLRYNYGTQTTVGCGFISPRALTDEERADLVARYQTSWDQHISQYCKHGCRYKYKEWPTP